MVYTFSRLLMPALLLVYFGCGCSTIEDRNTNVFESTKPVYILSGQGRTDKAEVMENRLALAAGDIERVACRSFAGHSAGNITDSEEIKSLFSLLESGVVVDELPYLRFTGVVLEICYDAEKSVSVCTTPAGEVVEVLFHGLPWVDAQSVCLKAPEFTERLHTLAGWRYYDASDLKNVNHIRFSNDQGSFELNDTNLIEPLVKELQQSTYTGPTKCPFEKNHLVFYRDDGIVYGIVAGDGCPTILLNGNVYQMSQKAYSILQQLVEGRGLSLVPMSNRR